MPSMTRKRMRSVPFGRLAGFQCLMVSLVVCSSKYAGAWVPSSSLAPRKSLTQSTTTLYAEDGVLKFVKGLDSALGNPTAYSAATAASKAPAVSSSVTAVQSSGGAATMTAKITLRNGFDCASTGASSGSRGRHASNSTTLRRLLS